MLTDDQLPSDTGAGHPAGSATALQCSSWRPATRRPAGERTRLCTSEMIVPAAPPEGQTGRRRPLTARQAYPSRRRRRRACDERDHAPVADEMRDLVW